MFKQATNKNNILMNILHSETLNRVIHCLKGLSLPAGILSVTANFIDWFTSNKLLQKLSSKLSDGNILATDNLPAVTQLRILQEINGKSEAMLLIFMSIYCKSMTQYTIKEFCRKSVVSMKPFYC